MTAHHNLAIDGWQHLHKLKGAIPAAIETALADRAWMGPLLERQGWSYNQGHLERDIDNILEAAITANRKAQFGRGEIRALNDLRPYINTYRTGKQYAASTASIFERIIELALLAHPAKEQPAPTRVWYHSADGEQEISALVTRHIPEAATALQERFQSGKIHGGHDAYAFFSQHPASLPENAATVLIKRAETMMLPLRRNSTETGRITMSEVEDAINRSERSVDVNTKKALHAVMTVAFAALETACAQDVAPPPARIAHGGR